jgi:hypothetical protein
VIAAVLFVSLAIHLAILAALAYLAERADAGAEFAAPSISARVAPPTRPSEPTSAPPEPSQEAAKASPRTPAQPSLLPKLALPPKPIPERASVDVTVAHDVEPAIEASFSTALARDYPSARRIALEFEAPPIVRIAPEAMGESSQRMLRALVQVKPLGDLELLQTHEYDVPYMDAIRDALHRAKAAPTPDGEIGWAILVFWFHRTAPAPR